LVNSAFWADVTSSGMRSVAAIKLSIYVGTSHVHIGRVVVCWQTRRGFGHVLRQRREITKPAG